MKFWQEEGWRLYTLLQKRTKHAVIVKLAVWETAFTLTPWWYVLGRTAFYLFSLFGFFFKLHWDHITKLFTLNNHLTLKMQNLDLEILMVSCFHSFSLPWFYMWWNLWSGSFLESKKNPEIVEKNVQKNECCLFPSSNLSPLYSLPLSPRELMADGNYI